MVITGSIMTTGLPNGNYRLGVNDAVVVDGDARLESDGTGAGSTPTAGKTLLGLLGFTGEPLEQVLPLLTGNLTKLIGVCDRIGSIGEGKGTDVIVLDKNCRVIRTYSKGREVYQK